MGVAKLLVVAGGALAVATTGADAAFTLTYVRTQITGGTFAGMDRVNLVLDNWQPAYTIGAIEVDVVARDWRTGMRAPNALKFRVSPEGVPNVYPPADVADVRWNASTAFNPGGRGSFAGLPGSLFNLATPDPNLAANRPAFEAGLDEFEVDGVYSTPLEVARADAPFGIVIGSAVVPAGTTVEFSGTVDNDLDPGNGRMLFNVGFPIPEPAGLAGLTLAGAGLLGRPRRRGSGRVVRRAD